MELKPEELTTLSFYPCLDFWFSSSLFTEECKGNIDSCLGLRFCLKQAKTCFVFPYEASREWQTDTGDYFFSRHMNPI